MFKHVKRLRTEEGFTLIELLVVIVILGVLAGIVVFSVSAIGDKGQTSACQADLKSIQIAEEAAFANSEPGIYLDEAGLVAGGYLAELSTLHAATVTGGGTGYAIAAVAPCTNSI